jgi:hypothetical protein
VDAREVGRDGVRTGARDGELDHGELTDRTGLQRDLGGA